MEHKQRSHPYQPAEGEEAVAYVPDPTGSRILRRTGLMLTADDLRKLQHDCPECVRCGRCFCRNGYFVDGDLCELCVALQDALKAHRKDRIRYEAELDDPERQFAVTSYRFVTRVREGYDRSGKRLHTRNCAHIRQAADWAERSMENLTGEHLRHGNEGGSYPALLTHREATELRLRRCQSCAPDVLPPPTSIQTLRDQDRLKYRDDGESRPFGGDTPQDVVAQGLALRDEWSEIRPKHWAAAELVVADLRSAGLLADVKGNAPDSPADVSPS